MKPKDIRAKPLDKEDFLSKLSKMDKNQIADFIKANGKQPKLICPIIVTNETFK